MDRDKRLKELRDKVARLNALLKQQEDDYKKAEEEIRNLEGLIKVINVFKHA